MQDDLLDLIVGMQSKRMDEQRVALPHLPGLHPPAQSQVLQRLSVGADGNSTPDDTFLEMLMRCQVSTIIYLWNTYSMSFFFEKCIYGIKKAMRLLQIGGKNMQIYDL